MATGKLLTVFKNPKVWKGWNRTVAAIIDSEFANRTGFTGTLVEQTTMDINKGAILNTDTDFDTDNAKAKGYMRFVPFWGDWRTLYSSSGA